MRQLLVIALFFPLLANAQLTNLKFSSEFEQQAFSIIDSTKQPKDILRLFFAAESSISNADFELIYNQILAFNETQKLHKNPRHLFEETQNRFFSHYELSPTISSLIVDSTFSCLTGSALMSFFLEINDFEYAIKELPFHVFLNVKYKNRDFILETTDTAYGYLPDIESNRRAYQADSVDDSHIFNEIGDYSNLSNGKVVVSGKISFIELAGLNYYNTAINHLNNQDYELAVYQLQKAYYLYPSLRIKEATKYSLLQVLSNPQLSKEEKIPFYEMLMLLTYSYSAQ
ncbi:MAG: hypothetical protein JXQ87_03625 [Bacteroidia bacterium]